MVIQQVAAKGQVPFLKEEEEEEIVQSSAAKKNKPTAVRSAAPARKKITQVEE